MCHLNWYFGSFSMFLQKVLELKDMKLRWITTHRDMSPFMVDMDKCSFYIGKNLYLVL